MNENSKPPRFRVDSVYRPTMKQDMFFVIDTATGEKVTREQRTIRGLVEFAMARNEEIGE